MSQSMSGTEAVERGWHGPWYRVRTVAFEASFLPSPDEDLDSVCNVDVFVDLQDGSRWTATVFTVAEVERRFQHTPRVAGRCGGAAPRWIEVKPGRTGEAEPAADLV
ncbi:hypothetical protein [Streptomyces sp. NPDC101206]|uniref:hypothetical protein n=1 Tax=Streptomyces sp. NPDC101206 TaxID=3366128 RepID=UPI0038302314